MNCLYCCQLCWLITVPGGIVSPDAAHAIEIADNESISPTTTRQIRATFIGGPPSWPVSRPPEASASLQGTPFPRAVYNRNFRMEPPIPVRFLDQTASFGKV